MHLNRSGRKHVAYYDITWHYPGGTEESHTMSELLFYKQIFQSGTSWAWSRTANCGTIYVWSISI